MSIHVFLKFHRFSKFCKSFSTKAFDVSGDKEWMEITGGFREHCIEQKMKESELETFLSGEVLCLEVYNGDSIIGTTSVNLSRLFDKESQMEFQKSFSTKLDILDQSDKASIIGSIDCLFALVTEKCVHCLNCTNIFKFTSILKHFGKNKDCKMAYSSDDIESFKKESKRRKKCKELKRQRKKYDCDKRSEKHKREYESKKRAQKYQKKVEEKKEKLQRINKIRESKFEIWFRKYLKDKTKSRYLSDYEFAKNEFFECYGKVKHLNLSEDQKLKIKQMKAVIESTKVKFESIVEETVEKAKQLSSEEMSKAYSNLIPTKNSKKEQEFLFHEWHEIRLKNDLAFKNIALEFKEPYEWSNCCTCVKCSKAKTQLQIHKNT